MATTKKTGVFDPVTDRIVDMLWPAFDLERPLIVHQTDSIIGIFVTIAPWLASKKDPTNRFHRTHVRS
jgi:hypothetical protein